MRTVGNPGSIGSADYIFLPKDWYALAIHYLWLPDRAHRLFAACVGALFFLVIGCFIRYAVVEKFHLTDSAFYGQVKFSFVDRGYPEIYGYMLELFCLITLASHAWQHNKKHWYAWTGIFLITFLDDWVGIHEMGGYFFHDHAAISAVQGGVLSFALIGLLLAGLWCGGLWAVPKQSVELAAYLLFSFYFGLLVMFGVGVDAYHAVLKETFHLPETVLTLLEDGAELLLLCVFAISTSGIWCRYREEADVLGP